MSTNRELPTDRLATSERSGARIWLYPADVAGRFRSLRDALSKILILVFLLLPWLKVRGYQAVLLDIPNRRFSVFGLTFWAHDAPILIFVLGGAALSIALVTIIWGRIWCGWACPQTVFVDGVFRKVERWLEGNALNRKKLDEGPWNLNKIYRKSLKWLLFIFFGAIISHSFLAYFVGTERLAQMMTQPPFEHPVAFIFILAFTGVIVFDFGWFREQFCTLVCPYGRFQSVLMDNASQVVAYDTKRGEPRRGLAPSQSDTSNSSSQAQGDCVNCYRCVQVCPTGVDIRRGVQMECIACTACIDACDEVMIRVGKPKGLIRYATSAVAAGESGETPKWHSRPVVWGSGLLLLIFALGLGIVVATKQNIEITLLRAIDAPYTLEDPKQNSTQPDDIRVINHFKVEIRNQGFEDASLKNTLPVEDTNQAGIEIILSNPHVIIHAGTSERIEAFIRFPKKILDFGRGSLKIQFETLIEKKGSPPLSQTMIQEVPLVGPLK